MIQENRVREKIADAIRKRISVPDFSRWIMSNSWNMHKDSSPSTVSLVAQIHSLLAERSDLLLSDSSFLDELVVLNNRPVFDSPVDVELSVALSRPRSVNSERWLSVNVPFVSA
jgi:hypothetical protein